MKKLLTIVAAMLVTLSACKAQNGKETANNADLKAKKEAFDQKMNAFEQEMMKVYGEWKQLKSQPSAENETKAKQLEIQLDSIETLANNALVAFCKDNKDNELPADVLEKGFYGFSYDELNELLDPKAVYYNNPKLDNAKKQLAALAKRRPGIPFTDLNMNDMDGKAVKLSDYAGKGNYVLVDFWASWCGPCRMEMPTVVKSYQLYHAKGYDVVGVSFDSKADAWKQAVKDLGMEWHQMSDLKGWECAAHEAYGVNSIPSNVLLGPDGKIVASDLRGENLLKKLEEVYQ